MSATVSAAPRTRIDEAKAKLTIPVLWRMFNLRGDPGSPCRSPFREDRSPSFSVFDDGRRWIDHATAERGDAIDFLAKIKGISNASAFIELLSMADGAAQQPASTMHRSEAKPEPRPGPKLEGIEPCSPDDLWQIAKLRSIPLGGLRLAHERKLLFAFSHPCQGRCWLVTDDVRRNAISRRLDGKPFVDQDPNTGETSEKKSKCWKGSEANWPIGIAQASGFPAIALCEGMPDFLAAFWLAYAGAVESLVAPVCMTGSSCNIHADALPQFRGKRVRIFGHADETGQGAVRRWAKQLQSVEAEVDGFFFEDKANNLQLVKADGSPVKDLNDFLLADHKASNCGIEVTTGAFDFALERSN
jgi:hypothetical protein